jgi:Ser/Thr protein kinase RdoA (MazF antagonist)
MRLVLGNLERRLSAAMKAELRNIIENEYATGSIVEAKPLAGGYWNHTELLECELGNFVVRISPPRTRADSIEPMVKLVEYFSETIGEVPRPIYTATGSSYFEIDGSVATLWPLMPGKPVVRGDETTTKSAARMLARLHAATIAFPGKFERPGLSSAASLDWDENLNWRRPDVASLLSGGASALKAALQPPVDDEATRVSNEISSRRKQISAERIEAQRTLARIASTRQLITAPIHGDYYPGNLLEVDGSISAVLDWDECRSDWLIYEVARALWEFARNESDGSLQDGLATQFLETYSARFDALNNEFDLITSLIRCIRIEEVVFSLGEAVRGEWWDPEYTLYNLIALDNLPNSHGS